MSDRDCPHGRQRGKCADCDVERLEAENEALKTVMIAAAEEISANWDAHCDADGYGPANLMHRLEKGIPSQYGYTAGEFERLRALNAELMAENEALKALNAELVEALKLAHSIIGHPDDAHTQMIDAAIDAARSKE